MPKYTTIVTPPIIKPIYVTEILRDVVDSFTPSILPIIQANETIALQRQNSSYASRISTINYQYGHPKELIGTLAQLDKSAQLKFTKYPLVYLYMDFGEDRNKMLGSYATVNLNIILLHQTQDVYKMQERMEYVFKPVLYPIYYALLNAITLHPYVNEGNPQELKHKMFIRGYWGQERIGGTDGNNLNDYVDAMDITNLQFTILNNNC